MEYMILRLCKAKTKEEIDQIQKEIVQQQELDESLKRNTKKEERVQLYNEYLTYFSKKKS
jgi:hypothetical protein